MSSYYLQLLENQGITLDKDVLSKHYVIQQERRPYRKAVFAEDGRRICCICLVPKDSDQYTTKTSSVDGKDPRCNPCKSKQIMERQYARG